MINFICKFISLTCMCAVLVVFRGTDAIAYETFNDGCNSCHGDFKGTHHSPHISMVSNNCGRCHIQNGDDPSIGLNIAEDRGCVGCHGRSEDAGNDSQPGGLGAGLRQHHDNAGITDCSFCHSDADPSSYTPVGEDVFPPFYSAEGLAPCTDLLDNDGDDTYDGLDSDCTNNIYGSISGDVIEGVTVGIYTIVCGAAEPVFESTTDENGIYQYGGLANGRYLMALSYAGYSFAPGTWVDIPQETVQPYDFTATAD